MSFDRDIKAIFGEKADEFTDHHKSLLKRVWDCGRREGDYRAQGRIRRFFQSVTFDKEHIPKEMPRGSAGLPPEQMEQMEGFWRESFDEGYRRGTARLDVVFTRVVKHLPVNEVFDLDHGNTGSNMSSLNIHFKEWVTDAFQQVLHAENLEDAHKVADEQRFKYNGVRFTLRHHPEHEYNPREPQRYECHVCKKQVNMLGMGTHKDDCPRKGKGPFD